MVKSIQITFNQSVDPNSVELTLSSLGVDATNGSPQVIPLDLVNDVETVGRVTTLDLTDVDVPDGVFQINIAPSVTNAVGSPLDGNGDGTVPDGFSKTGSAEDRLYKLIAEWNGDGGVSVFDFTTFSYWFGTSVPTAPEYVDLNGDDGISVFDFTGFSANFGVGIVYPLGFAGAVALPVEEVILLDQQQEAIEQFVEIPLDNTEWDLIVRRPIADKLIPDHQRLPLDELDLELEAVLDSLADDIALAW